MKMYRTIKGKKIHVNQLAANSRKFTVKNIKKGISPIVAHKRFGTDIPKDKLITNPLTGNKFVMVNPHTITGDYGVTVTGYDWVPIEEYKTNNGLLWEHKKYPQPKSYWRETVDGKPTMVKSTSLHKDPVKMTQQAYWEKLVQHKLARWEKKNPQPCPNDDLFKVEYQVAWYEARDKALERFRDFVVSVYDPLTLTGRFVVGKGDSTTYQEKKVAEIKDINGEGHVVNSLSNDSKLMKKVQEVTDHMRNKYPNLISCHLMDHKKQHGRIILPQAA